MSASTSTDARRDFRNLWAGQLVSEIGSKVTRDGVPMLAVTMLAATPAEMGILVAIPSLSILVVGILAGLWVDRVRRRPLLILTDLIRAIVVGTVPLAGFFGLLTMPFLYVVATASSGLAVLFEVSSRTYIPTLVGRERIVDANAKLEGANSIAEVVGAALTGFLVQLITAPIAIALDAVSYLVSAISILRIRTIEAQPVADSGASREPFLTELFAGYRIIVADRVLRASMVVSVMDTFFGGFIWANYILYVMRDLRVVPTVLGLLIATGGIGSLFAAIAGERLFGRLGLGRALLAASIVVAITTFGIAGPSTSGLFALTCLFAAQLFGDFAKTILGIGMTSIRQVTVPEHILGRSMAAVSTTERVVGPLGALAGGALATALGPRATLFMAALGLLATAAMVALSPLSRVRLTASDET